MGKSKKKEKAEKANSVRQQYEAYLEEERKRKERNDDILRRLDRMRGVSLAQANQLRPYATSPLKTRPPLPDPEPLNAVTNTLYLRKKYPSYFSPAISSTHSLIANQHADDNIEHTILKEISKKYILIPKIRNKYKYENDDLETMEETIKGHVDTEWKAKYDILEKINLMEHNKNTGNLKNLVFNSTSTNKSTRFIEEDVTSNQLNRQGNLYTDNSKKESGSLKYQQHQVSDGNFIKILPDIEYPNSTSDKDLNSKDYYKNDIVVNKSNENMNPTGFQDKSNMKLENLTMKDKLPFERRIENIARMKSGPSENRYISDEFENNDKIRKNIMGNLKQFQDIQTEIMNAHNDHQNEDNPSNSLNFTQKTETNISSCVQNYEKLFVETPSYSNADLIQDKITLKQITMPQEENSVSDPKNQSINGNNLEIYKSALENNNNKENSISQIHNSRTLHHSNKNSSNNEEPYLKQQKNNLREVDTNYQYFDQNAYLSNNPDIKQKSDTTDSNVSHNAEQHQPTGENNYQHQNITHSKHGQETAEQFMPDDQYLQNDTQYFKKSNDYLTDDGNCQNVDQSNVQDAEEHSQYQDLGQCQEECEETNVQYQQNNGQELYTQEYHQNAQYQEITEPSQCPQTKANLNIPNDETVHYPEIKESNQYEYETGQYPQIDPSSNLPYINQNSQHQEITEPSQYSHKDPSINLPNYETTHYQESTEPNQYQYEAEQYSQIDPSTNLPYDQNGQYQETTAPSHYQYEAEQYSQINPIANLPYDQNGQYQETTGPSQYQYEAGEYPQVNPSTNLTNDQNAQFHIMTEPSQFQYEAGLHPQIDSNTNLSNNEQTAQYQEITEHGQYEYEAGQYPQSDPSSNLPHNPNQYENQYQDETHTNYVQQQYSAHTEQENEAVDEQQISATEQNENITMNENTDQQVDSTAIQ